MLFILYYVLYRGAYLDITGISFMKIIVGTTEEQNTTDSGDILEMLTADLLRSRGYVVSEKVRITGAELDLLCRDDNNPAKQVYVECKAYNESKKIDSSIVKQLFGTREAKGLDEAWLVSTSEFNRDATGLVDETEHGLNAKRYTFITPERFVKSLVSSNIIASSDVSLNDLKTVVSESRKLSKPMLLFTEYGYFWIFEYMPHGDAEGYIFYDARDSEPITDAPLLDKLFTITQLNQELNFSSLLHLLDGQNATRISAEKLALNNDYLREVNSLKYNIQHSGVEELHVNDIFVYPDLDENTDAKSDRIDGKAILKKETINVVIYGDDLSGKTTLLHQYQRELVGSNVVPIFLNASDLRVKTMENLTKVLVAKFREQYTDTPEYESYIKSVIEYNPEIIILLIDDLPNIGIKREASRYSFVKSMVERFTNTIFTVHRSSELEFLAKSEWKQIFLKHTHYTIMQFGHLKRDDLIEKWLTAHDDNMGDAELLNSKKDLSQKVNIATGKGFVPAYPFYLSAMLQILETGSNNMKDSAYGELYTYLITSALGEAGAKHDDLDFYKTYLSHLAHYFYEGDLSACDQIEMERFFQKYIDEMSINKNFQQVNKLLVRARILVNRNDGYGFQFSYIRYYFIAKYLSDTWSQKETKTTIAQLVTSLNKDKHANIIIFLIHHSKNPELIESIIAESKKLFSEIAESTLSIDEVAKYNELITEQISPEFKDTDPGENRRNELTLRDRIENSHENYEDAHEVVNLFGKIQYAFRLMDVLGQIANSYYGSLDGKSKADIINEIYSLGLRSMNALLHDYGEYIDGLRSEIRAAIINKNGKTENIDKLTNNIVYSFTQIIVFAFIKKTSDSVLSKNLFPVLSKLGYDPNHTSKRLVTTAIKLNFPDELNFAKEEILKLFSDLEKNFLTRDVLRFLVLNHLYNHHVNSSLKQSICTNLDIRMASPANRLLTPNAS